MKKILIGMVLAMFSSLSFAKFETVKSDVDKIACRQAAYDPVMCRIAGNQDITIEQFVAKMGYKEILSIDVAFSGGEVFKVITVRK